VTFAVFVFRWTFNAKMPSADLQTASFNFSLNLGLELIKSQPHNDACFSPASATLVLAMVYFGSGGKTRQQLRQTLFKNLDDEAISRKTGSMITAMDKSNDKFTMAYANRLYASQNYDLKPMFVSKLQQDYRSEVKKVMAYENVFMLWTINKISLRSILGKTPPRLLRKLTAGLKRQPETESKTSFIPTV